MIMDEPQMNTDWTQIRFGRVDVAADLSVCLAGLNTCSYDGQQKSD